MIVGTTVHAGPAEHVAGGASAPSETPVYVTYKKGAAPVGAIVVRIFHSGEEVRAFVCEVTPDTDHDNYFPSEELEVETALRLAENKVLHAPDRAIYVVLTEGVEWNPAWGTLD
jgi:hypothetical protein